MSPYLALLALTDTFCELWNDLAAAAGTEVRPVASVPELLAHPDSCGLLVAAGGREREAAGVLEELRAVHAPETVVVGVGTDYRLGISLLHAGARNYFALPPDLSALRGWMVERVERAEGARAAESWAAEQRRDFDFSNLVGSSPGLRSALARAAKVIPRATATVLITGETGTGKDLLARAIHFNSPRAAQPIVEVNCAAIPAQLLESELFGYERGAFTDARTAKPGLFEAANGGTLFLDEVGDLSPELQAKLLRVLEEKRVRRLGSVRDVPLDVRIIAATHVDLSGAVRAGRFRQDLYYRLSVAPVHLPPLRERGDDALLLAEHYLDHFCAAYNLPRPPLANDIRRAILGHAWPGNVRELKNAVERALLFGEGRLDPVDLFLDGSVTPLPAGVLPFPASLDDIQRAAARAMLERCGGNKAEAARNLGISRKRLYELLR